MLEKGLDVLCLQELYRSCADSYLTEEGFLVILSGGPEGAREDAGVGFLVAPAARPYIITFKERTNRMASLKIRVTGGQLCLISAYAPHGGLDFALRWSFFDVLSDFNRDCHCYGSTIVLGDLNSRIHRQCPGEESVIGRYAFGNDQAELDPLSNRSLLLELCNQHSFLVANTFFEKPLDNLVTYRGWGIDRFADISHRGFAQLDHILVRNSDLGFVDDIFADRTAILRSQHFLVTMILGIEIPKDKKTTVTNMKKDLNALKNTDMRAAFRSFVWSELEEGIDEGIINDSCSALCEAMRNTADILLQSSKASATKPWISTHTLRLIDERNKKGPHSDEGRVLKKAVKDAAKEDRRIWLNKLIENGDWDSLKFLRKPRQADKGRLKNIHSRVVAHHEKAETLAQYFSRIQ